MPSFELSAARTLARYDVVGKYSAASPRFVAHVALHNADTCAAQRGASVIVVHMGPPLEEAGVMSAHAVGRVPLTNDEIKEIAVWIEQVADEYRNAAPRPGRRRQYVIHPPWRDRFDPRTGVRIYRRFSCAGFVLDAHRQVQVDLLNMNEEALPPVDKTLLALAYPNADLNTSLLQDFGIHGDPPWRIVLAGYVLHAMNRSTEEIRRAPYRAKPGDELF
jgi:hypothetical protein